MNVKKVLNNGSWILFAVGIIWIISGPGNLPMLMDFIIGIGMILVAGFLNLKSGKFPQEQDNNGKG